MGFGDASFGVVYSPEYTGIDTSAVILNAGYSLILTDSISLDLHAGYTKIDDETKGLAYEGSDDYLDYSIGLTVPFGGVDLSLVGYGTDVSDENLPMTALCFQFLNLSKIIRQIMFYELLISWV